MCTQERKKKNIFYVFPKFTHFTFSHANPFEFPALLYLKEDG